MIHYDEEWIYKLLFRLEGSVAVRSVIHAFPAAVISVLLLYIEDWYPDEREKLGLLDLKFSQLYVAASAILVFLLGFRTKQALSRFWEGSGLLHQMRGEWFDTVSNCVTFSICALKTKSEEVHKFRHTIVRLMSLCHGSALEEIAGNQIQLETIDIMGLDHGTLQHLKSCHEKYGFNKVEVMLHLLQSLITNAHEESILKIPPPILSRVYQTISRGFVNLLNAKKISDTKFPFPFVQLITGLILVLNVGMPFVITSLVKSKVLAAIFSFFPLFGMFALDFISIELENPFGTDANDLPLQNFQHEMNNCLLMLLHYNTDLIAGVSSTCIMDFEELVDSMAHVSGKGPLSESHKSIRLSDVKIGIEPKEDGGSNDGKGMESVATVCSLRQKSTDVPACSNPTVARAAKSQPDAATRIDPGPAAGPQQAAPETEPNMTELQFSLAKHMTELNISLTRWTKTINDQVNELTHSFDSLRTFSDTIPGAFKSWNGWECAVGPIA